jgi:hypothetical protein
MDRTVNTPALFRFFAGILVRGARVEIELVPTVDGTLSVRVRGTPALTGFADACLLGDPEARRDFAPDEVKVDSGVLRCMAADRHLPTTLFFREGFMLELDPGQSLVLQTALPELRRVAVLAQALAERLRAILPAPLEHKLDFAANIAARVILDARTPAEALRLEAALHFAGKDSPFCAAFGDAEVVRLLCDAHGAAQP